MITDSGIQAEPGWGKHAGGSIGGCAPLSFGFIQGLPTMPTAMLFYAEGSTVPDGYADWEAYILRPICQNTGKLQLSFDLYVDAKAALYSQARETDTIICYNGDNYNLSLQVVDAQDGLVQVGTPGAGWAATPINVGKPTPNVKHTYAIDYEFDIVGKTCRVASLTLDGQIYTFSLPAIAAEQKGWADGALVQVQQDLNAQGGQFSMLIDNMDLVWS
jgi:hypothetical protein